MPNSQPCCHEIFEAQVTNGLLKSLENPWFLTNGEASGCSQLLQLICLKRLTDYKSTTKTSQYAVLELHQGILYMIHPKVNSDPNQIFCSLKCSTIGEWLQCRPVIDENGSNREHAWWK